MLAVFLFIISVAIIFSFGQLQIRSIERNYGITGASYDSLTNPIRVLSKGTESVYQQLRITANREVEKYDDIKFFKENNSKTNLNRPFKI